MNNQTPYKTLIACVIVTFVGILVIYMSKGGPVTSRLGFAAFISVLPAVVAEVVLWWGKRRSWGAAVGVYYAALAVLLVAQGWIRTW